MDSYQYFILTDWGILLEKKNIFETIFLFIYSF